jgi:hypothetical protein
MRMKNCIPSTKVYIQFNVVQFQKVTKLNSIGIIFDAVSRYQKVPKHSGLNEGEKTDEIPK